MRDENVRVREKFELSLDGRQIASIVVGALVILGVVFVLGLNVGRQIAARQVEAARGGDLEALDRVPVAAAQPAKNDLTFYDQLPKGKPAPPPPEPARPAPAPAQPAAVHPAAPAPVATSPAPSVPSSAPPSSAPAPVATPPVAPSPSAPALAAVAAAPASAASPVKKASVTKPVATKPSPPARSAATDGAFVIQLAATPSRAEAERLVARHHELSPRIETADVPGKGRFYRVRAGSFGSRAEAERALAAASRQSGAKGFVTAAR